MQSQADAASRVQRGFLQRLIAATSSTKRREMHGIAALRFQEKRQAAYFAP